VKQLLSINGNVVIGSGFETTMDVLRDAETLDLMLFEDLPSFCTGSSEPRHTAGGGGRRDEDEGTMFDDYRSR
jgi:hypothetical protein